MGRNRCHLLVLIVAGCGAEHGMTPEPEPEPEPVTPPAECIPIILDGNAAERQELGPFMLGTVEVCLRLDGRLNRFAHFMASTQNETGLASSFVATLRHADGTLIRDGWDVTVGHTDPTTFASIEWGFEGGSIVDVVLRFEAKSTPAATGVGMALFEPLE